MLAVTLAQAMTPFPYSISPERTVVDAEAMMSEHAFHHLPVTTEGVIVGVLTALDCRVAAALVEDSSSVAVETVYSRDPYVVDIHAALATVLDGMVARGVGSALVTRQGKLAGILTHTDVCRALAELVRPPPPGEAA